MSQELFDNEPLFVLINGYAEGYSPLAFAYNLAPFKEKWGGEVDYGDLTIEETHSTGSGQENNRLLPAGIFARWHA